MALPLARWFDEVEPIPVADAGLRLGLIAMAWALLVFLARRLGIVDRIQRAVQARAS